MDSKILFVLTICLLFANVFVTSTAFSPGLAAEAGGAEKVKVKLYYETLCPYCANFIVNYLIEVFEGGIDEIADVELVPYGNAKISSNGTITCQHGPRECLLNSIEACAMHVWPGSKNHFPFILCVERAVYKHKFADWDECFEKLHLDSKPVMDCYNSGYGNKLELQYGTATNSLEPPHTFVPWVVVDGRPLRDDYEEVVTYICRAYKGRVLPKACLRCLSESNNIPTKKKANPVTYKDDVVMSVISKIRTAAKTWI